MIGDDAILLGYLAMMPAPTELWPAMKLAKGCKIDAPNASVSIRRFPFFPSGFRSEGGFFGSGFAGEIPGRPTIVVEENNSMRNRGACKHHYRARAQDRGIQKKA